MKYAVVILDGAAGWPAEFAGGKTSLEAARTPHLDALAHSGILGMARTVPEGMEPSSSAACTSILGYDPVADYVGRGAIEAASMGVTLAPDQVALRLNLVSIIEGVMASYSSGNIPTEESSAIVADIATALNDDTFTLHPGVAYRHILVVTGHPELLDVSYTPPHDISDRQVRPFMPKGPGSELLLDYMQRARPLLENCGVNRCRAADGALAATDVWPFWPGSAPKQMRSFRDARGVSAAMTSGVDLLNGLAVLAGIDRLDIAGVTGGSDNDYAGQALGALDALDDHDLVFVHIESPDEEGHAGDAQAKIRAIEDIDREVIGRLRPLVEDGQLRLLAMPDHPTPVALKTHVGEPVPFVIAGAGCAASGRPHYDEPTAESAGLSLDPGRQVMDLLLRG